MPADKLVLDDRIELEEPLDEVPSVLPDAVPEEPIVVGVEPEGDAVPQELEDNAKAGLIMAEISSTYDAIDRINSVIATVMDPDSEKWSDVVSVLNSVADDLTLVVGKLHTALGIADPDAGDAIHQGMQDAGDEVGIDFEQKSDVSEAMRNKETGEVGELVKDFGNGWGFFVTSDGEKRYQIDMDKLEEVPDEPSETTEAKGPRVFESEAYTKELQDIAKSRPDEVRFLDKALKSLFSLGYNWGESHYVKHESDGICALRDSKGSGGQLRVYFKQIGDTLYFVMAKIKKDQKMDPDDIRTIKHRLLDAQSESEYNDSDKEKR